MSLFIFPFETQIWVFPQLFSTPPTLLSTSCLIPPLGTSPEELPQVLCGTAFASPTKITQPDSISRVSLDNTREHSFPCCIAVLLSERPGKCSDGWWKIHTHTKHHLHQTLGNGAGHGWFTQQKPFPVVSILIPKKVLAAGSRWNCSSHLYQTQGLLCMFMTFLTTEGIVSTKLSWILLLVHVAVVCMEQMWSDIPQMHRIAVETPDRNQERYWDIKSIELRWSQTQAHPYKNITLILWD